MPANIIREETSVPNDGQDVTGVVAVASTSALAAGTACQNAPASILTHARPSVTDSGTNPITSSSVIYAAQENADGDDSDTNPDNQGTLTITGLTPKTSYYIAACSVSTNNIRGDNGGTGDEAIAITTALETPGVVVIYKSESALSDSDDHVKGGGSLESRQESAVGVDICEIKDPTGAFQRQVVEGWGVPPGLAGTDYADHTFYGSRNGANGNFSQLPARLGVTDPDKREVWVFYVAASETKSHTFTQGDSRTMTSFTIMNNGTFLKPSTRVTLSELIALTTTGNYTNQEKVSPVFRLLQNGNETTANSNFEHWSYTGSNGGISQGTVDGVVVDTDCATGTNDSGTVFTSEGTTRGGYGRHNGTDDSYIGGGASRQDACTAADKTVLCIVRQDSGF